MMVEQRNKLGNRDTGPAVGFGTALVAVYIKRGRQCRGRRVLLQY